MPCAPRPRVAILSTGDELVEPGSPLGPAQVRNSNAHALEAQITLAGGRPRRCPIVPDDPAALRSCLEQLLPEVDLIVTAAGASVGEHDFVQPVLHVVPAPVTEADPTFTEMVPVEYEGFRLRFVSL